MLNSKLILFSAGEIQLSAQCETPGYYAL